jgi:hypothetical protein
MPSALLSPVTSSFGSSLRLPFAILIGYVLAVPALMWLTNLGAYHAWWFSWWMAAGYHIAIGCLVGVIRVSDGDWRDWLRDRAPWALAFGLAFIPFFTAFTAWKHGFWRWGFFVWDRAFSHADKLLHFGRFPHEWLLPLTSSPAVLQIFDWVYLLWGAVIVSTLSAVLWLAPPDRCRQYVITFLATWIVIGSLLAPLLGSVGPVYYARVVSGPDPYTSIAAQVQGLQAHVIQEWLWIATNTPTFIPVTGISAMPSVHIAQATLVALIAWTSRWWLFRALGLLFLILLQLSTVALGWHYAIDGYVAACLTLIFWRLSAPSGTNRLPIQSQLE